MPQMLCDLLHQVLLVKLYCTTNPSAFFSSKQSSFSQELHTVLLLSSANMFLLAFFFSPFSASPRRCDKIKVIKKNSGNTYIFFSHSTRLHSQDTGTKKKKKATVQGVTCLNSAQWNKILHTFRSARQETSSIKKYCERTNRKLSSKCKQVLLFGSPDAWSETFFTLP